MAAFVVGGLSLIGIPLTAGFVSKWYLITAAIEQNWWPLVIVIVVGSLISVAYIWKVVEVAYLRHPGTESEVEVKEAPLGLLIPTWVAALANIYFGIDGNTISNIVVPASKILISSQ